MPLSKPTASNETDWREARMWLREMAGMGLHRIEFIMDGMTLILPTKSVGKIFNFVDHFNLKNLKSARGQSHLSRRRIVLTPGSRMFDGPMKFRFSPIRFNERKSYDQVTQGPLWGSYLHEKIQATPRWHHSSI